MFIRVVFPLPFSPRMDNISPFFTDRHTLSLAVTLPNRFVMFFSSMAYDSLTRQNLLFRAFNDIFTIQESGARQMVTPLSKAFIYSKEQYYLLTY